jgi:hypothetical protein
LRSSASRTHACRGKSISLPPSPRTWKRALAAGTSRQPTRNLKTYGPSDIAGSDPRKKIHIAVENPRFLNDLSLVLLSALQGIVSGCWREIGAPHRARE